MRYWVSWISGNYADEGCTKPGIQFWVSGYAQRRSHLPQEFESGAEKDDCTICALIDAPNEEAVWAGVARHFPDYEQRFIEAVEHNAMPGERFPDFKNRTVFL